MTEILTSLHEADDAEPVVAIAAHGLLKKGARGVVYGPIDMELAPGTVALISGRDGSGKTSLLLTLAGRMKPDAGDLNVLGYRLPARRREVQRRSVAVGVKGLDDLDGPVSVAATLRERLAWIAPWYRIVRTPNAAKTRELLEPTMGAHTPDAKTHIEDLSDVQDLLLRLALARLADPDLIVLDQIDQLHDTDDRDAVWQTLREIAHQGVTVVVSATSPHEADRLGWELTHLTLSTDSEK